MNQLTPFPIRSDVVKPSRKLDDDYARWFTLLRDTVNALANNVRIGTGDPNGVVTAPQGAIFLRSDGAAGTTVWSKTTGGVTTPTNTGWVALT